MSKIICISTYKCSQFRFHSNFSLLCSHYEKNKRCRFQVLRALQTPPIKRLLAFSLLLLPHPSKNTKHLSGDHVNYYGDAMIKTTSFFNTCMGKKGKHLKIKKTAICEQQNLGRVSFRQKTNTERSSKGTSLTRSTSGRGDITKAWKDICKSQTQLTARLKSSDFIWQQKNTTAC